MIDSRVASLYRPVQSAHAVFRIRETELILRSYKRASHLVASVKPALDKQVCVQLSASTDTTRTFAAERRAAAPLLPPCSLQQRTTGRRRGVVVSSFVD